MARLEVAGRHDAATPPGDAEAAFPDPAAEP